MPKTDESFVSEIEGTKVNVQTPSTSYHGWVWMWNVSEEILILYDGENKSGEKFDRIVINDIESIEQRRNEEEVISVELDRIHPSKYNSRNYNYTKFKEFQRKVNEIGHITRLPTIRKLSDQEYEVVSGHGRIRAARINDFSEIPARVIQLSEWEAARYFVNEHIPLPSERKNRSEEFYTDDEIDKAIAKLRENWSDEKLRKLPALESELS